MDAQKYSRRRADRRGQDELARCCRELARTVFEESRRHRFYRSFINPASSTLFRIKFFFCLNATSSRWSWRSRTYFEQNTSRITYSPKIKSFASLTLTVENLRPLSKQIYAHNSPGAKPDLVVYLQAFRCLQKSQKRDKNTSEALPSKYLGEWRRRIISSFFTIMRRRCWW